jgi:DNA-binding Lrp family transcriptional regulator
MEYLLSDIERKVLAVLQGGFPRSQTPFKDMAKQVGIGTEQLLAILERWKQEGKVRRLGSIIDHFKVGLSGGAMVIWQVEPQRVEQVGAMFAGFKEVSHAYERSMAENWPFNLYTMVHGADIREVEQTVQRMSRACGVSNYRILTTEKELKKVPPTYFPEQAGLNHEGTRTQS